MQTVWCIWKHFCFYFLCIAFLGEEKNRCNFCGLVVNLKSLLTGTVNFSCCYATIPKVNDSTCCSRTINSFPSWKDELRQIVKIDLWVLICKDPEGSKGIQAAHTLCCHLVIWISTIIIINLIFILLNMPYLSSSIMLRVLGVGQHINLTTTTIPRNISTNVQYSCSSN